MALRVALERGCGLMGGCAGGGFWPEGWRDVGVVDASSGWEVKIEETSEEELVEVVERIEMSGPRAMPSSSEDEKCW